MKTSKKAIDNLMSVINENIGHFMNDDMHGHHFKKYLDDCVDKSGLKNVIDPLIDNILDYLITYNPDNETFDEKILEDGYNAGEWNTKTFDATAIYKLYTTYKYDMYCNWSMIEEYIKSEIADDLDNILNCRTRDVEIAYCIFGFENDADCEADKGEYVYSVSFEKK